MDYRHVTINMYVYITHRETRTHIHAVTYAHTYLAHTCSGTWHANAWPPLSHTLSHTHTHQAHAHTGTGTGTGVHTDIPAHTDILPRAHHQSITYAHI